MSGKSAGWGFNKVLPKAQGMNDYTDVLGNRVFSTLGPAQMAMGGPQDGPVVARETECLTVECLLQRIHDTLKLMPAMMVLEFRRRLQVTPREAVPFYVSGEITIAAPVFPATSVSVIVVQSTVAEGFGGFLTHIGCGVTPIGAAVDVRFDLRLGAQAANSVVQTGMNARIINATSTGNPVAYPKEIVQGNTIALVATNVGPNPVTVQGVLMGWTELLADYKDWGASSASMMG